VAVTDETANPQAVRVSAVRLVLADAPHLPMVGRRPLWLVTVAGFPNPAAPLVYPDAGVGQVVLDAATGHGVETIFFGVRPPDPRGLGTVFP
jgi:hypothetical protein